MRMSSRPENMRRRGHQLMIKILKEKSTMPVEKRSRASPRTIKAIEGMA
jgi:hypothetical protein